MYRAYKNRIHVVFCRVRSDKSNQNCSNSAFVSARLYGSFREVAITSIRLDKKMIDIRNSLDSRALSDTLPSDSPLYCSVVIGKFGGTMLTNDG